MKTAIEWLVEQLEKDNHLTENEFLRIIQQAKEMEKEQIIEAVDVCMSTIRLSEGNSVYTALSGESFYKEKYILKTI